MCRVASFDSTAPMRSSAFWLFAFQRIDGTEGPVEAVRRFPSIRPGALLT
jgi:hypothetical protein